MKNGSVNIIDIIAVIYQATTIIREILVSNLSLHSWTWAGVSKPSTFWTALPLIAPLPISCMGHTPPQLFFTLTLHDSLLGQCVCHLGLCLQKQDVGRAWNSPAFDGFACQVLGRALCVQHLTRLNKVSCRMGNSDGLFLGWAPKDRGPRPL